jgi:hypothetical protein
LIQIIYNQILACKIFPFLKWSNCSRVTVPKARL